MTGLLATILIASLAMMPSRTNNQFRSPTPVSNEYGVIQFTTFASS